MNTQITESMTPAKARLLLGKQYNQASDKEIQELLILLRMLIKKVVDSHLLFT